MPVSYILFTLMKILKEHNRKTTISRGVLLRIIGEFIIESYLSNEVKSSLLQDYDFDYDIEMMLDNYAGYLSNEDGMITLSPYTKIETIDSLLEELSYEYDEELLNTIDDFYDFNIHVLEMLGIKMEKELYKKGVELENDIKTNYEDLALSEMYKDNVPNDVLYNLKKNIIKRKFLFNQVKNNLTLEEYNDFYRYAIEMADILDIDSPDLKIENDEFELTLETDPFLRALFFIDSDKELIFSESLYASNKYVSDEEKSREIFFTRVIDTIDKRTDKIEYDDIDNDLITAKYQLMYALDMLYQDDNNYNGYLFMGDRNIILTGNEDYSFIEKDIFYLIDEIFEYTDIEVTNDLGVDYSSNIKAILIETYYDLTKDERVIEAIKNHSNFSNPNYHFTAGLFDNFIKKSKKKIKRKEDE